MLQTVKIENTLDVQEVMINDHNTEGVILSMIFSNPMSVDRNFDLLLGTNATDRVIIYSAKVPANSIADLTKKIAVPSGKTLYISMEDGIEYATISMFKTTVDIVTADNLIMNMVSKVETMKDAVAHDRYVVEQKVAGVEPHYDAIEDCSANMQSIIDAPYYANIALSSANFKGEWDEDTTYQKGDSVYLDKVFYMSKIDDNESNEPSENDDTYWVVIKNNKGEIDNVVDYNGNGDALKYAIMQDQDDLDKKWKLYVSNGNIVLEELN